MPNLRTKFLIVPDPAHIGSIAGLGRLRYVDPLTPVVDEIRRWLPNDAVFDATIEIRNPCNYRCFYCICKGQNNTPVQRFDLAAVEAAYSQIKARMIVSAFECGGGEPTVHPQFPELLRIVSGYGYVSFPTNNSQDPSRWLPLETAKRITVRSAVHPEAEGNLEKYCEHARYLINAGCNFVSLFIAHPTRISKIPELREYFASRNVPFNTIPFGGDYEGKTYPHSYTDEEQRLIGLTDPAAWWTARVDPHVTRIRNFRGIPCTAGQRSMYIKNQGTVLRCMFDQERKLDHLLTAPEICGVKTCGCGLRLEKLNQLDIEGDVWMNAFGPSLDLPSSAYDWIAPMTSNVDRLLAEHAYSGRQDALSIEAMRIYDALMAAYGKDDFPE